MKNNFWFKVCRGEKGKLCYVLSENFWGWIKNEIKKDKEYGSKKRLVRKIMQITKNEISQYAIENWIYKSNNYSRKPIIIKNNKTPKITQSIKYCVHGYEIFCPFCNINKKVKNCPVPLLWKTHNKGKIYVFDRFWIDFIRVLKNCEIYGLLPCNIQKQFNIDPRIFRKWRNENKKPSLYSTKEFSFSQENLYWLGIHFSDGHLRNNGSKLSFTWQTGSSNPFQGYWYPQFIQTFMDIFTHKKERSLSYLTYSKSNKSWFFRTNMSSFSPIFAKFLEEKLIIERKQNTVTSGYLKYLPKKMIKDLISKETLFQGIIDGDGSYSFDDKNSILIYLVLDPYSRCDFIEELPLVPTTAKDINGEYVSYQENKGDRMREIRFAPSSLSSISKKYSVNDIINQFKFLASAAEHSIRPDKVHTLIKIIKRISSKDYGEYRHCLEIQKRIRDEVRKTDLIKKITELEKRFPISNGYYKPFIPKWAESFISKKKWKQEFWDFFLNGDFLNKGNYPKPKLLDFSNGVPVNFDMTMSVRK